MTNREWLNSLSNEEFYKWLFEDSGCYSEYNQDTHEYEYKFRSYYPTRYDIIGRFTDSHCGMLDWLNEERSNEVGLNNE